MGRPPLTWSQSNSISTVSSQPRVHAAAPLTSKMSTSWHQWHAQSTCTWRSRTSPKSSSPCTTSPTRPPPMDSSTSKLKGMYGLPQVDILAQDLLEQRLNKHGYHQSPITPGLWQHDYWPISFTLCVDNFGIKYVGREHAKHLAAILSEHYKCSHD